MTRSEAMRATVTARMAEGTWHIPIWTDEMKQKRAATMRAKSLGKTKVVQRREKLYRRVMTADGYRYEHRVIMERILGRKLERWEHVHHINEDGLDNRPENLEVKTVAEHARHHGGRPRLRGWSRDYGDCCARCGTTSQPHSAKGYCKLCYMRVYTLAKRSQESSEVDACG